MSRVAPHLPVLGRYLFLTYVALLINAAGYLRHVHSVGLITPVFVGAVYLTWCWLYVFPIFLLSVALDAALALAVPDRLFRWAAPIKAALVYSTACLGFGLVQTLLYADKFIYGLYGFHLNGFVWNLVTTKGGIESMGSGSATTGTVALIVAGWFALQAGLLILLLRERRFARLCERVLTRRVAVATVVALLVLGTFQAIAYGVCSVRDYRPVLITADVFPFYRGLTFRKLAKRLGFETRGETAIHMRQPSITELSYPLAPIVRRAERKPYNIVWLVAESWRWDMLDPDVTPATWAFAQKATRFTHHYSAGHGTRMAMFGMFYGLSGNYWWSFLRERRSPVLVDLMLQDGYQMGLYTSAKFTYPELDVTLFARLPKELLHEDSNGLGWERDRRNVARILEFISRRDPARPFMTFLFLESPHAPYFFPPENAIRKPYLETVNYATMDVERDAPLLKNRYINSCNHLDSQFRRILEHLEALGLLDSTIVLLTSDHGEAFMEKGRWGHNSDFTDEQTRTPMVLWIPGRQPAVVGRMTSHLDIPATLLPYFGVSNPPVDYSLGYDMLGETPRPYAILAGWNNVAYFGPEFKAIFATKLAGMGSADTITTADDLPVPDDGAVISRLRPQLLEMLKDMHRFGK